MYDHMIAVYTWLVYTDSSHTHSAYHTRPTTCKGRPRGPRPPRDRREEAQGGQPMVRCDAP